MNLDKNHPAALVAPKSSRGAGGEVNGVSHADGGELGDTTEFTYDRVPPKRVATVTVHYQIRGRGRPLYYPVEEGNS